MAPKLMLKSINKSRSYTPWLTTYALRDKNTLEKNVTKAAFTFYLFYKTELTLNSEGKSYGK